MNRTHRAQRVIIYQNNRPFYPGIGQCGGECCKRCVLIFFTIMFLLVGFIVTMVGHFAEPFWGPEDDWCSFCREDRLKEERNLKNCRIVGPIFLAIGGVLLFALIFYCQVQRKKNQGQVISQATTGQTGATGQGGTDTATASSQYPANTFGYQPYPPGPYPNNPPPPAPGPGPGAYSPYPMGQVYPPASQHPYPPPNSQGAQPYQTDVPPPPSYESVIDQSTPSPSAPPLEKVD